ncbi:MAG: plasmid mobilization protein [Candidatus Kariarchaeaceae archaeon]|jgi:predicted DNA-binding protein
MGKKDEQITLRISSEQKEQLQEMADTHNMTISEYLRDQIEEMVNPTAKINIESRVTQLEERFDDPRWRGIELKTLKAVAMIVSIDTKIPIDKAIREVSGLINQEFDVTARELSKVSRIEREKYDLLVINELKETLSVSEKGLTLISLLVLSYLSIAYNDDLFQMTDFSIETMDRIRGILSR